MQLLKFHKSNICLKSIVALTILSSCGSYQYSGTVSDGIYSSEKNEVVDNTINKELNYNNSPYYKNAFSEKSQQFEPIESDNDILFTDAEQYQSNTKNNDSISTQEYGPWGSKKDNITINIYGGNSYPNWLWNYGYGYGNIYGYGIHSWGYGYGNFWSRPYYNNFNNGLFYPFWNFNNGYGHGYGYGYGYGYGGYWNGFGYGYPHYYNHIIGRNNTNIAHVYGRRGSRNAIGRSMYTASSRSIVSRSLENSIVNAKEFRIKDLMNKSNLRDRTSRIEDLRRTTSTKPGYYNKAVGSQNSYSKPATSNTNNSKPRNSWKPASSSNSSSKPSYNNTNNNYSRPSHNSNSNSRPSFNSSSSSNSRSSGSVSTGSRSGGRSGRN
jgi:hypothetical protein